ncbi:MAG: helix-turn-helix transcriptional regulator [Acidimicrobiia bacterium]|nr:helix-turn-helix transcriptional regulator [Acidimicrobiia bacterium]
MHHYPGDMTPVQLLRAVRRRQGLSQAQLAERAGTSQPVISAYEHGRRDPRARTLGRLVAAAGERLELRVAQHVPDVPPATTPEEHADRLLDVLLLADALPSRPRPALTFPRITST